MNSSKFSYGILAALMLNLAMPVQAGWFSDWFSSRGAKVTVAAGALAVAATGFGYLYYLMSSKKKKSKSAVGATKVVRLADEPQQDPKVESQKPATLDLNHCALSEDQLRAELEWFAAQGNNLSDAERSRAVFVRLRLNGIVKEKEMKAKAAQTAASAEPAAQPAHTVRDRVAKLDPRGAQAAQGAFNLANIFRQQFDAGSANPTMKVARANRPKDQPPVAAEPIAHDNDQDQAPRTGYTDADMAQMEAGAKALKEKLDLAVIRQRILANKFVQAQRARVGYTEQSAA